MIDIDWWVFGLLVLGGIAGSFGLGLAIGLRKDDDERAGAAELRGGLRGGEESRLALRDLPEEDPGEFAAMGGDLAGLAGPGASDLPLPGGRDRAVTQVYSPLTPYADWREQTAAELAPAHLDELAERIDLPGPATNGVRAGAAASFRAGELDWPTDTRLPAILTLGQAGDGSDKTFARASLAQWDFMVRFRDERDELDRMLAAGRAA
jgi:hypothetical protein